MGRSLCVLAKWPHQPERLNVRLVDCEEGPVADIVRQIPEALEFHTLSGDPDVLIRLRADDVDHLQRIVNTIRRTGKVAGTKTLIVMHGWTRSYEIAVDAS